MCRRAITYGLICQIKLPWMRLGIKKKKKIITLIALCYFYSENSEQPIQLP